MAGVYEPKHARYSYIYIYIREEEYTRALAHFPSPPSPCEYYYGLGAISRRRAASRLLRGIWLSMRRSVIIQCAMTVSSEIRTVYADKFFVLYFESPFRDGS